MSLPVSNINHIRFLLGTLIPVREIVDIIMKPILAAVKVQAYGRGLLARFSDHRLSYRNFVPALRREAGAFTRDELQEIYDDGWSHTEFIQPDMIGYNAIRRTRGSRRSVRGEPLLNRRSGRGRQYWPSLMRSDRMDNRANLRFRWMLSSRDLSGNPLIQN